MDILIAQHETSLRLGSFLALLVIMMLWERFRPRRALVVGRRGRWPDNFGLLAIDGVIVRFGLPLAAVGVAQLAMHNDWGALKRLQLDYLPAFLLTIVLLDLLVYAQHVAFHRLPWLWRVHRVHHSDNDFDVTTAVRFHPIEIVISMGTKMLAIVLLGAPVAAVIVFEMLLNGGSTFSHSNVAIPPAIDRWWRLVMVTPDMHRVHHSIRPEETNSNYGFFLPWWDRLFRTYRAQPLDGHARMTIGLSELEPVQTRGLWRLLAQPLARRRG